MVAVALMFLTTAVSDAGVIVDLTSLGSSGIINGGRFVQFTPAKSTGSGVIDILMVQPEGRRAMAARDFVAGHRLAAGAHFDAAPAGTA